MLFVYGFFLVIPLMLIIITGNLLRVKGFYTRGDIDVLTKTLYWVILPPLLFRTTYLSGREVLSHANLFWASTLCYLLTVVLAWIGARFFAHKGDIKRIALSTMGSIRANNIYLGFPVIYLALGDAGLHEAAIYIAVSTVSFQLISLISGELALNGNFRLASLKDAIIKITKNPMVVSCLAGVLFALTGLEMPMPIDEAMKLMGGAATAIALLALGGALDFSQMSRVVRILTETWYDTIFRLVIHPLIMWGCLLMLPVEQKQLQVTVMLASMPTAINVFILSKEMGMDEEYGANMVAATMVLSVVSIPLWANILSIV